KIIVARLGRQRLDVELRLRELLFEITHRHLRRRVSCGGTSANPVSARQPTPSPAELINTAKLLPRSHLGRLPWVEMAVGATPVQLTVPTGQALHELVEVAPTGYDSTRLITGSRPRPTAVAWAS